MENEEFNFNDRIKKLKNLIDGAAVITGSTDIFYFTGFMANGIDRLIALVIDEDETTLIVPSLHANEVKNLENRMNVIVWTKSFRYTQEFYEWKKGIRGGIDASETLQIA